MTTTRRIFGALSVLVLLLAGGRLWPVDAQEPLTLLGRADLAEDRDFVRRVQMACTRTAVGMLQADPQAPGYAQNVALATAFLREPQSLAVRLAWVVASSESVDANLDDATLVALIEQRWPAFAAVLVP